MSDVVVQKTEIVIEALAHPRVQCDWQVRCEPLLPRPIWFKDRECAISYCRVAWQCT